MGILGKEFQTEELAKANALEQSMLGGVLSAESETSCTVAEEWVGEQEVG